MLHAIVSIDLTILSFMLCSFKHCKTVNISYLDVCYYICTFNNICHPGSHAVTYLHVLESKVKLPPYHYRPLNIARSFNTCPQAYIGSGILSLNILLTLVNLHIC